MSTSGEFEFVVIGAGMAGGRAIDVLSRGGTRRVALVGAEGKLPYSRPPLSKEILTGEIPVEEIYMHDQQYYEDRGVELILDNRAIGISPDKNEVLLQSGAQIGFEQLLIATGVQPRHLPVPGADLKGVFELGSLDDATRLRGELQPGKRVVIIGGGLIGCEIAAAARYIGADVDIIEMTDTLLRDALGPEVGKVFAARQEMAGVQVHLGSPVSELVGSQRVERVVTASGLELSCDIAVVGIGVRPELSFLEGSNVEVDNGVVVDEYCVSSREGIYAAGDMARYYSPRYGRRLRVEHETSAQNQAIVAARNMMGGHSVYDQIPYVWSKQYDLDIWYLGNAQHIDSVEIVGEPENFRFIASYFQDDQVAALIAVNRPDLLSIARKALETPATIDAEELWNSQPA